MAAITIYSDFGAQKVCHCFPMPLSDGTRYHDLSFWMLSFKPTFSLSTFTFIKRLFSYSSFSAIKAWSSVVKFTHCNQVWDSVLNLLLLEPTVLISSYPDTQSSGTCVNQKKQTCCLKAFTFGGKNTQPAIQFSNWFICNPRQNKHWHNFPKFWSCVFMQSKIK